MSSSDSTISSAKNGIAARARSDERGERRDRRARAHPVAHQLRQRLRTERRHRQLQHPRLARPVGLVLGAEVDQQQRARRAHRLDDLRQEQVAAGIDPVQVVDQQHDRLGLGAQLHQTAQEGEEPALAHRGLELERRAPSGPPTPRKSSTRARSSAKASSSSASSPAIFCARLARPVLLGDAEQVAQQLEQRQIRNRLAVRRAVGLVDHRARGRGSARRTRRTGGSCRRPPRRPRRRRVPCLRARAASADSSASISSPRPTKRDRPRAREVSRRVRWLPTPSSTKTPTGSRTPLTWHRPERAQRRRSRRRASACAATARCRPAARAAPCAAPGRRCGPAPCSPCAGRRRSCRRSTSPELRPSGRRS